MSSSTVTIAVHVELFPFTSVTVSTTEFEPTSSQSKLVGVALNEATAQLSVLPPSTSAATIEALPAASS